MFECVCYFSLSSNDSKHILQAQHLHHNNFGFFMRGKYQFILMFVVGTHVFAKCLQKQRGGLLKYFFLREGLRVTALLKWYKST